MRKISLRDGVLFLNLFYLWRYSLVSEVIKTDQIWCQLVILNYLIHQIVGGPKVVILIPHIFSLPSCAVMLACALSFNVDQKNSLSFDGPLEDLFGYTVQQFENHEGKW